MGETVSFSKELVAFDATMQPSASLGYAVLNAREVLRGVELMEEGGKRRSHEQNCLK